MKYGILTYHNIPNIGAILQAQALCQYIRSTNRLCEIIDYTCDNIVKRELTFNKSSNLIRNIILKYAWKKNLVKIAKCGEYVSKLNLLSLSKYNRQNICLANKSFDAFISGSDMIWNLSVNGEDYSFFLDFVEDDKKRVSFASSIGSTWTEDEKKKVFPLLKKYDSISVREEDTCVLLNQNGVTAHHLADPTLLLSSEEWLKYSKKPKIEKYVLVYFPSCELIQKAKAYAKQRGLKVVVISQGLPSFSTVKVSPNDPPEWIGLFANADGVFTNSYHGLLFSFYFEKPVWTANYGNRILSFLDSLDQVSCRLDYDKDLTHIIDYRICNQRLEELRSKSQQYIIETLCKIEA